MEGFSISIGESIPIYRISAVRDTSVWPQELIRTIRQKVSSSEDAAKTMTSLFVSRIFRDLILDQGHNDRENLMIAAIDENHTLNGVMLAATGSEEEVTAGVKTVIRSALQMGATFLVIGHNHPNGITRKRGKGQQYLGMEPSESDLRFTTQLYAACAVVGIQLVDHLIMGGVDPKKWRSGHEQPYLSMWGRGYFRRDVFPALAEVTISNLCPEVKLAARLAKKKRPRP